MLAGLGGSVSRTVIWRLLAGLGVSLIAPPHGPFFAYGVACPLASRCAQARYVGGWLNVRP